LSAGCSILDAGYSMLDEIVDWVYWLIKLPDRSSFKNNPNSAIQNPKSKDWILDAGYSMLDAGCWMLDTGYSMLDAGYWILDTGCWMLDAGCWMLDAGYWQ